jgi:DNA-binding CsgD family transcriptional regulator
MKPPLTPREREVAKLVATHRTAGEIASELEISEHTVRDYIHRIGRLLPGNGSPMRRIAVWWVEHGPQE